MSYETLSLGFELAAIWAVGMTAAAALVVATVDRLNVRVAELEERIEAMGGGPRATPRLGLRRDEPARLRA